MQRKSLCSLGAILLISLASYSFAQEGNAQPPTNAKDYELPIIDQDAFDKIFIKAASGGEVIKVAPLPFPSREVPAPEPGKKLQITWLERPDEKYEIDWADIEKIELYEQMIMNEIDSMSTANDFSGAMRYIGFLYRKYPKTPNLDQLRKRLLLKNGAWLFSQKQYEAALVVMESLYRDDRRFEAEKVSTAISKLADTLIGDAMAANNLPRAQQWIRRFDTELADLKIEGVEKWKNELASMAKQKFDEAIALKEQEKYREAKSVAQAVIATWPELEGVNELIAELDATYPVVRVGVMQKAVRFDPSNIINWSARRAGNLTDRSLFELRKIGTEGGSYQFPLGSFRQSDDRKELLMSLDGFDGKSVRQWDAYWLSQWIASRANPNAPEYQPTWASIFRDVVVTAPGAITVRLRNPHVLPQALMQWPFPKELFASQLPPSELSKLQGLYALGPTDELTTAFLLRDRNARVEKQPIEISEKYYTDPDLARNDLLRGEIDAIDQIFPADAARLATVPELRVDTYALPTVYSIIVRPTKHAYLKKLEFRRALLYGLDREKLLFQEILGSVNKEDARLISGPFPAGTSVDDPLAYAYDFSITPYPYQPRLAKLLVTLTQKQLEEVAKKTEKTPEKLTTIRLGVPSLEAMQVAGAAMVQQWQVIGIPAELVVLPPGETLDQDGSCDLILASAAIWEPATDAERLLGDGGPAAADDPFIVQGLRSLRSARNWREVRSRTQELHRLVHYHLPILPLWQIVDRFAVRKNIQGVASQPASLYQDVQRWRLK